MYRRNVWRECKCFAGMLQSRFRIPQVIQDSPKVVVRLGIVRIKLNCLAIVEGCVRQIPVELNGQCQMVVKHGEIRLPSQSFARGLSRRCECLHRQLDDAQAVVERWIGEDVDCVRNPRFGRSVLVRVEGDQAT